MFHAASEIFHFEFGKILPELTLGMDVTNVTEGLDYGDVGVKQETPDTYTVKSDMFPSGDDIDFVKYEIVPFGSQSGANNETKCDMLPSASTSGADSDMVQCGSQSGTVIESLKCDMLPSECKSGAADTEPQYYTGSQTGKKENKGDRYRNKA